MEGSKRSKNLATWARGVGVICAVIIKATGVTRAALQSTQASLLNNSISSATADLRIGTSATSFAASRTGFAFVDLVPGGPPSPTAGHSFFLKNYGSARLAVAMTIGSIPINASAVGLDKLFLVVTRVDTSSTQTFSVSSLIDSYAVSGLPLNDILAGGGTVAEYKLQVVMGPGAFSGQSALVDDIDIVFSGTGVI